VPPPPWWPTAERTVSRTAPRSAAWAPSHRTRAPRWACQSMKRSVGGSPRPSDPTGAASACGSQGWVGGGRKEGGGAVKCRMRCDQFSDDHNKSNPGNPNPLPPHLGTGDGGLGGPHLRVEGVVVVDVRAAGRPFGTFPPVPDPHRWGRGGETYPYRA